MQLLDFSFLLRHVNLLQTHNMDGSVNVFIDDNPATKINMSCLLINHMLLKTDF